MEFETILLPERDAPQWDAFVGDHPEGRVYHLSSWGQFLESAFGHRGGSVIVQRDRGSGRIVGGLPFFATKSILLGRRVISSPFATLGGPLVSNEGDRDHLFSTLLEQGRRSDARQVVVRGVAAECADGGDRFTEHNNHMHHFLNLPDNADQLKASISRWIRRRIARANQAGVEVLPVASEVSSDALNKVLRKARRELGLPLYPGGMLAAIRTELADRTSIISAVRDGQIFGVLISLNFNGCVIAEHIGVAAEGRELGVSQLLYWKDIERAIAEGYGTYSFGRTSKDNQGLLRFKRGWGTIEEPLYTLRYPPQAESGRGASSTRGNRVARRIFRALPIPVARVTGKLFYRHWA